MINYRLLGAKYVTAPVITYLDSHCECTEGEILCSDWSINVVLIVFLIYYWLVDNVLFSHWRINHVLVSDWLIVVNTDF